MRNYTLSFQQGQDQNSRNRKVPKVNADPSYRGGKDYFTILSNQLSLLQNSFWLYILANLYHYSYIGQIAV